MRKRKSVPHGSKSSTPARHAGIVSASEPLTLPTVPATFTPTPPPVAERDRAIRRTVAASIVAKAISVACTLAHVPIALHALGVEAYGVWITLATLGVVLNFVDFGLGVGLQRGLGEAWARGEAARMQRLLFTGAAALSGLAAGGLALCVALILLRDWSGAFNITSPALRAELRPALLIALGTGALGIPLNALARLAAATRLGWLHAGWIAAGSVVTLTAIVAAAQARLGLVAFTALVGIVPLIQGLALGLHLWHRLGWQWSGISLEPAESRRALLAESGWFAGPQLGLALLQAAPPLALSLAAGPVAATGFNLFQRLTGPILQAQIIHLTPLWAACTEAHARGDGPWLRRALRQSLLVAAACAFGVVLVTLLSRPLLSVWVGVEATQPALGLAWPAAGWFLLQIAWLPPVYFLVGIGRLRALALWGVLGPAGALFVLFGMGPFTSDVGRILGLATLALALLGLAGLAAATRSAVRELPPAAP